MRGFQALENMRLHGRMSLTDVAERMKTARTVVMYMEQRATQIAPKSVLRYARAVGADPVELITEMAKEAIEREIAEEQQGKEQNT